MARILRESFEAQDLNLWDVVDGSSIVSTAGLSLKNDYCLSSGNNQYVRRNIDGTEIYFAFQLRTKTVNQYLKPFSVCNDLTKLMEAVYYSTDQVFRYTLLPGVSYGTININSNCNYFIQVYYKIHNTVGRLYVKINGIVDLDFTGGTLFGSYSTFNNMRFGDNCYNDNIVIDDSQMPEQTEIALLRPNAVGSKSNWTPSAGNNYECVDEVPFSDSDYVSADVVDMIDTYGIENLPIAAASIKGIQVQARVRRDTDAVPNKANLVLRANGMDYHGDDKSIETGYTNIIQTWDTNPTDGQPFEKSDIDALEIGIRPRS